MKTRITAHLIGQGKARGAARNAARQVCGFYGLDENAIWITFADGLMRWTNSRARGDLAWRKRELRAAHEKGDRLDQRQSF